MKKCLLYFLLVIVGLIPIVTMFGQKDSSPKWIEGTWHNSYESNTNNFVFWTFSKDKIFIGRGLEGWKSGDCLNKKYVGYKMTTTSADSTYRVEFKKADSTVVYNFMLKKVNYAKKPVLTYILTVNGHPKIDNSTSINLVLTK